MRARLFLDFIDATKTLGDEQASLDALAFKQRIGADCRAVAEIGDVIGHHALVDEELHACQNST